MFIQTSMNLSCRTNRDCRTCVQRNISLAPQTPLWVYPTFWYPLENPSNQARGLWSEWDSILDETTDFWASAGFVYRSNSKTLNLCTAFRWRENLKVSLSVKNEKKKNRIKTTIVFLIKFYMHLIFNGSFIGTNDGQFLWFFFEMFYSLSDTSGRIACRIRKTACTVF